MSRNLLMVSVGDHSVCLCFRSQEDRFFALRSKSMVGNSGGVSDAIPHAFMVRPQQDAHHRPVKVSGFSRRRGRGGLLG